MAHFWRPSSWGGSTLQVSEQNFAPRISLIATFYNAANYLDRCVKSLLCQSHGNYEVILIDDGSSDNTFEMLKAYSSDAHVRCFTKQNDGAGSARNYGVVQARGEYVSFVDGDDFVSPYYIEEMDLALLDYGCDFAVGAYKVVRDSDSGKTSWDDEYSARFIPKDQAAEMLGYNELTEAPWGKLAPKWLYVEHPFPEKYYEDVAVAGRHFLAMGDVAYCSVPIYGYVMRKGSVVHRRRTELRQLEDFVWAINQFLDPLEEAYPQYASAFEYRRALEYARAHSIASLIEPSEKTKAAKLDAALLSGMALTIERIKDDKRVPSSQLFRFFLLCKSPSLYDAVFSIYERVTKTG